MHLSSLAGYIISRIMQYPKYESPKQSESTFSGQEEEEVHQTPNVAET